MLPTPREALITLNLIPGLGSVRIRSLMEFFGSAELVLAATPELLSQVPRIGPRLADTVADWRNCTLAASEQECAERHGVRMITLLDDDYPAILRRMSDPPVVLYVRGEWNPEDEWRPVSVVGSRLSTPYGMTIARRFSRELAEAGSTIISGMAHGIDTAAHWGALDAGGRTIAILGSGMAQLYPKENETLAARICNGHGAVVSEFPMNMRPSRTSFPQRNRIVAASSKATLVVEAPHFSGSMITARLSAEEYGNNVFAVPGPIDRPSSAGCHALIRDGAILCTSSREILADMHWEKSSRQMELTLAEGREGAPLPLLSASSPAGELLQAIAAGHQTLDALCSALGRSAGELTPLLMRLQVEHAIIPQPGGRYCVRPD